MKTSQKQYIDWNYRKERVKIVQTQTIILIPLKFDDKTVLSLVLTYFVILDKRMF